MIASLSPIVSSPSTMQGSCPGGAAVASKMCWWVNGTREARRCLQHRRAS